MSKKRKTLKVNQSTKKRNILKAVAALFISTALVGAGYVFYNNNIISSKAESSKARTNLKKHLKNISFISPTSECPSNTSDAGIRNDAYIDGVKFSTRLCRVYDSQDRFFLVSPIIASNLKKMILASGNTGNINTTIAVGAGSGFRSASDQKKICKNGRSKACNNNSLHQAGLAVDISCATSPDHVLGNNEGAGKIPKDTCWAWVRENASKYGLLNQYATHPESWAEPWHISTDSK